MITAARGSAEFVFQKNLPEPQKRECTPPHPIGSPPTSHEINKLKKIIPPDQFGESVIVCNTNKRQLVGHGVEAIPWNSFSSWLETII